MMLCIKLRLFCFLCPLNWILQDPITEQGTFPHHIGQYFSLINVKTDNPAIVVWGCLAGRNWLWHFLHSITTEKIHEKVYSVAQQSSMFWGQKNWILDLIYNASCFVNLLPCNYTVLSMVVLWDLKGGHICWANRQSGSIIRPQTLTTSLEDHICMYNILQYWWVLIPAVVANNVFMHLLYRFTLCPPN